MPRGERAKTRLWVPREARVARLVKYRQKQKAGYGRHTTPCNFFIGEYFTSFVIK
jgi:hypothetical protein